MEQQQINPYEAGQALQQGHIDPSASMPVTPVALSALTGTKFWVSLVGIALMIIVVIQLVVMLFVGSGMGGMGGSEMILILMQVAMLVIYAILAFRLIQYGKTIGRLSSSAESGDFERAMEVQSKFWKLLGILCIVMLALMLMMMIVGAMFANSATRF